MDWLCYPIAEASVARSVDPLSVLRDLSSPEAKARLKAPKALQNAKGSEVEVQPLVDLIFRETNPAVMAKAVMALRECVVTGGASSDGVFAALAHALESGALSGAKDGRTNRVRTLELYPDHPIALKSLIDALGDSNRDVRLAAAVGLPLFQDPNAAEAVSIGLRSGTVPSANGRPRAPCLVAARTIDLFVGEDAVIDAFREHLAPEATITLALRVPWVRTMPRLGGIVRTDDRILLAFRNPNLAGPHTTSTTSGIGASTTSRVPVPSRTEDSACDVGDDSSSSATSAIHLGLQLNGAVTTRGSQESSEWLSSSWAAEAYTPFGQRMQVSSEARTLPDSSVNHDSDPSAEGRVQ
jgi:hypothetical protein